MKIKKILLTAATIGLLAANTAHAGIAKFINTAITGSIYSDVNLVDDVQLQWGTGLDTACEYDTAQTPDALVCGVSSDSNNLIITEKGDINTDYAHAQQTNPTLFIHAADQTDTTKWISISHDGTDGVIDTAKGEISIPDGVQVLASSAFGDDAAPDKTHDTLTASTLIDVAALVTTTPSRTMKIATNNYLSFNIASGNVATQARAGRNIVDILATDGATYTTNIFPAYNSFTNRSASSTIAQATSSYNITDNIAGGTITRGEGSANLVLNEGAGTITTAYSSFNRVGNSGAGSIGTAYGNYGFILNSGAGTITNAYAGFFGINKTAGTITNAYGLYIDAITSGGTNYAIYSAGGQSYHAGNFTIGTLGSLFTPSVVGSGGVISISPVSGSGVRFYMTGETAQVDNVTNTANFQVYGRTLGTQGTDVASANDLTLGNDGNTFEITGAVQINGIITTGWTNGSEVELLFASTPTLKHDTISGVGTARLYLANSADALMTAGSRMKLKLSEIGGVVAWRETGRVFP